MTQPFDNAGDGLRAGPAPGSTAAGSRAAGGSGPGVPLSIWPGLSDPGGVRDGLPCGGPVTVAAARLLATVAPVAEPAGRPSPAVLKGCVMAAGPACRRLLR